MSCDSALELSLRFEVFVKSMLSVPSFRKALASHSAVLRSLLIRSEPAGCPSLHLASCFLTALRSRSAACAATKCSGAIYSLGDRLHLDMNTRRKNSALQIPVRYFAHRVCCAAAIRDRPSCVFGPELRPPCNRHRYFPRFSSRALHLQRVPRRVGARQRILFRIRSNTP